MRAAPGYNRYRSAEQRRQEKAARRSVLVQCDICSAKGSGTINAAGRLVSTTLRAVRVPSGKWFHSTDMCGGLLVSFDIEVGE